MDDPFLYAKRVAQGWNLENLVIFRWPEKAELFAQEMGKHEL